MLNFDKTDPKKFILILVLRIKNSIYNIYHIHIMVKTLRISDDSIHKELLKIQGQIQAKSGEFTSMEDVLEQLIKAYKKRH